MSAKMDTKFIDSIPTAFREGDAKADEKLEELENVALVKEIFRVIASNDFNAMGDFLADDVALEILGPSGMPFAGTYNGREQVIEITRHNFSLLENQVPQILSVVAQGNAVVLLGRETARLRQTGSDYELHWMQHYTFREGKLVKMIELIDTAALVNAAKPVV
jgi:ketosteroid isomerase-like protein